MFSKQGVTYRGCELWVHTSYCNPNKVRFGSTFVQKDNFNVCTKFLKYVGNHNRLCLKCLNCHKLMINHRLSYKQALQTI